MSGSTVKIAWRNLGRHKRRTALAVAAIAVGQLALLATMGIMHGYNDNIHAAITGPMVGHVQLHAPAWRQERAMDLTLRGVPEKVELIETIETVRSAAPRIYAPALAAPKREAFAAVVVGIDIAKESESFGLLSGMKEKLPQGKVLIGYRLARKMSTQKGDEIAIVGQAADGSIANDLYIVHDIIRSPADLINQSGVVMSLNDAQYLMAMSGQAHEIVVRGTEHADARKLAGVLKDKKPLQGTEISPWQEIVPEFVLILKMSDVAGYIILGMVFIAAIAGVANTLMMSTFERMHEFGMLLALGSRPQRLVRMIVVEALLLGMIGVIAGTIGGYLFTWGFSETGIDIASWSSTEDVRDLAYKGLNLPLHVFPRLELWDSFLGLCTIMLTSLLASVWPASIAARLEPMEAMRR